MEELSLLDWLRAKSAEPRWQRRIRFGLGSLAAVWGVYLSSTGGLFCSGLLVLLGLGLFVWGLRARGDAPEVPWPARPEAEALPAPARPAGLPLSAWLPGLRLPMVIVLAVIGQSILTYQPRNLRWGLLFYLCALAPFAWLLWRGGLLEPRPAADALPDRPVALRRWLAGLALFAGLYAFIAAGNNQFRPDGVFMWVVSVAAWLGAAWEGQARWAAWGERLWRALTQPALNLRLTHGLLLLLAVLCVGAYFRFARLAAVPPEMTSDHVEKLLDVGDLLAGDHRIFFERNTGREPLQFYAAAWVATALNTGPTHLTLKIVTAAAGFLLLPFIFLLGREVEDDNLGLLAALLAGFSLWATAISRVGLRFPLTPLFVAPVLYFLLRGVRRGARNDFLLAGLFLGAGLYGYSTFRVVPLLVVLAVAWLTLWPQARGRRAWLAQNLVLLAATAFAVFVPLFRYAADNPEMFWYRTLTRLTDDEMQIAGSRLAVFLANQWDALRMFNWLGDEVWVNTVTGTPALDFITGALFVVGVVYALGRLALRRDAVAGLLLWSVPVLLLPSSLNLAFPQENPSVVRAGGAVPVVFVLAAYPLWLLLRQLRARLPVAAARWLGAVLLALLLGNAALVNYNLYFVRYPEQYARSAQNASEIGAVIRDFAHSIGSYETAFVRPYPYWVDTRAVGMYADNFGWDAAIRLEDLALPQADPRSKLFITHRWDQESLAVLRHIYPAGTLSVYHSAVPDHDFLIYFVPGTLDVDEHTLPTGP